MPQAVRARLVELTAGTLGALPPDEIPPMLRRFARFEPRRRARLAASAIAAQLESDEAFRARIAEVARHTWPELAEAVTIGRVPPAADPVDVACAAYLLRPPEWSMLLDAACADVAHETAVAEEHLAERDVARLREQLAAARQSSRAEIERLRGEIKASRSEIADLRRRLHETRERARQAEQRAAQATQTAQAEAERAAAVANASDAELRRLRDRVAAAEAEAEAARRAARDGRGARDARLRVLLDALSDAVTGLRHELALPTMIVRPADMAPTEGAEPPSVPARALADDDPALLDHLLALPQVHLLVDGYNVTKTGYGTLPLADQRARLLTGLAALVARTRVEVTCVFDGADVDVRAVPAPRGVRVRFSEPGVTADAEIITLVRAEPRGRAVVVVSSDREVATAVRRAGARPVPAILLLRRLDRG